MEQITLGQIASFLAFVVALGGSITGIVAIVKKPFKKRDDEMKKFIALTVKTEVDPIKETMARIESEVKKTDKEATKNFLVTFLSNVDRGEQIDEIERQRFFEEWEHYTAQGGNGYLHAKVDRLREKGLL